MIEEIKKKKCQKHEDYYLDRICLDEECKQERVTCADCCLEDHSQCSFVQIDNIIEKYKVFIQRIKNEAEKFDKIEQSIARDIKTEMAKMRQTIKTAIKKKEEDLLEELKNLELKEYSAKTNKSLAHLSEISYEIIYQNQSLQQILRQSMRNLKTSNNEFKIDNLQEDIQKINEVAGLIEKNAQENIFWHLDQIQAEFNAMIAATPNIGLNQLLSKNLIDPSQKLLDQNISNNKKPDCAIHNQTIFRYCFNKNCKEQQRVVCFSCYEEQLHSDCSNNNQLIQRQDFIEKLQRADQKYKEVLKKIPFQESLTYIKSIEKEVLDLKLKLSSELSKYQKLITTYTFPKDLELMIQAIEQNLERVVRREQAPLINANIDSQASQILLQFLNQTDERIDSIENEINQVNSINSIVKDTLYDNYRINLQDQAEKMLARIQFINSKLEQREELQLQEDNQEKLEILFQRTIESIFDQYCFMAKELLNFQVEKKMSEDYFEFISVLQHDLFKHLTNQQVKMEKIDFLNQYQSFLVNLEDFLNYPTEKQFIDEQTKKIKKLEESLQNQEKAVGEMNQELINLQNQQKSIEEQLIQFELECKDLNQKNQNYQLENGTIKGEINQIKIDYEQQTEIIKQNKDLMTGQNQFIDKLTNKIKELEKSLQNYEKAEGEMNQELINLQIQQNSNEKQLIQFELECQDLNQKNQNYQLENGTIKDKINQIKIDYEQQTEIIKQNKDLMTGQPPKLELIRQIQEIHSSGSAEYHFIEFNEQDILIANHDKSIVLLDTEKMIIKTKFNPLNDRITMDGLFKINETKFGARCADGKLYIFNCKDKNPIQTINLDEPQTDRFNNFCLYFVESLKIVAAFQKDQNNYSWKIFETGDSGEVRLSQLSFVDCHLQGIQCVEQIEGSQFLSGSGDNTIKVWDLDQFSCTSTINLKNSPVHIKYIGSEKLIYGDGEGKITLMNFITKQEIRAFNTAPNYYKETQSNSIFTFSFISQHQILMNKCQNEKSTEILNLITGQVYQFNGGINIQGAVSAKLLISKPAPEVLIYSQNGLHILI